MKVSCFQNFLQVCTFLSQTPVTFALIMWKYLASLIFVLILFFFFWSGGIIVKGGSNTVPIPLSEFGAGILLSGEGVLAYDFLVAIIPLKIIFNNKGMV